MKVAVVGSGVAGMVTARRLHDAGHEVALLEARDRIGGHTATREVTVNGRPYVVDTGFIVFNERTYPGFCSLLKELGVPWLESDMSFSARMEGPRVEYNGTSTKSLFAQWSNVLRPRFWSMIRGILRFYKEAPELLKLPADEPGPTLGEYLRRGGYSKAFIDWHMVPMACAVWSGKPGEILDFPARTLVRFFANHGFLQVEDRPPWLTVCGGSRAYADVLLAPLADKIRLSSPVERVVARGVGDVEVTVKDGAPERFDRVVLACHADQALGMLRDPTRAEHEVLSAIRFQPNSVILHTDASLMPKRRAAWAAWNVHVPKGAPAGGDLVRVTYWMNELQSIEGPDDLFVTLNCKDRIDPSKVVRETLFSHPVYDADCVRAQGRHAEIDGVRGVHYCGAYWHYGFHEDGVQSARRVLEAMGVAPNLPARPEELRPGFGGAAEAGSPPGLGVDE
ncbi:MAG: FAD-dependent oxidoreductase [Planctomycetota bacterium]|nr:FAD-dependent oxidoreductase [Planctomycetota bacterium]